MIGDRPELFRGRQFADEVIVLCVRWCLRSQGRRREARNRLHALVAAAADNLFQDFEVTFLRVAKHAERSQRTAASYKHRR